MLEHGSRIVEEQIDTVSELKRVNKSMASQLDLLERWIAGDQDAIDFFQKSEFLSLYHI